MKATRLRKEVALGKELSPANKQWLDGYTTRTTIASARARSGSPAPAASSSPPPGKAVRGPQLSLVGDGPLASAVQQTVPLSDNVDPESKKWTPTMPEASPDAPPPPPGSPPPPQAGTPIVDDAATPPPQGGVKTAALVAGLVDAILTAGLTATDELFTGVKLPDFVRAGLDSPKARDELHKEVQAAAARMSIKRGWAFADGVASDEGLVIGVVALSGVAVFANKQKQKKLAAGPAANVSNANVNKKPNPDAPPVYGTNPGDADAAMRAIHHDEKGFAS